MTGADHPADETGVHQVAITGAGNTIWSMPSARVGALLFALVGALVESTNKTRYLRTLAHRLIAIASVCNLLAGCGHPRMLPPLQLACEGDNVDHLEQHVFETEADGSAIKRYSQTDIASKVPPKRLPCGPNYGTEIAAGYLDPGSREAQELNEAAFGCIIREAVHLWSSHKDDPFRLTFYFNGGLNATADVEETARSSYLQAQKSGTYLIYMIWPTGAWETWREGTVNIVNGRYENVREGWPVVRAPFSVASEVLSGFGQSPSALANAARSWYGTGYGIGSDAYNMKGDADLMPTDDGLISANHNLWFEKGNVDKIYRDDDPAEVEARRHTDITLSYAQLGVLTPVRVASTPFAIGFGTTMWNNMVRRARSSIRAVREFDDRTIAEIQESDDDWAKKLTWQREFPQGIGAFAEFFQWLASCRQAAIDDTRETASSFARCPLEMTADERRAFGQLEITMLGHSMGSIVINGLVTAFPHLPYENIVYMAGAASIRDTARVIGPLLSDPSQNVHFFNLMLHPMDEAREASSGGVLISGSLLFMVDDLFDQPKTIPDRTIGQWRNLRQARHLFSDQQQERMLFRVFSRTAPACPTQTSEPMMEAIRCATPATHSDFNDKNVPFWCPEFWGADQVQFKDLINKSPPWQWCSPATAKLVARAPATEW